MMDYNQTLEVLEAFYEECRQFWLAEGKDDTEAHGLAIKDVRGVTTNPFSPNGEPINPLAKAEIIGQQRVCDKCGKVMPFGFVIGDGAIYYCSEKCLYQDMTEEEYEELYDQDDAYWTTWEE